MSDLEHDAARLFCIGFSGTTCPADMRQLIARGVGGAMLFKRNFESAPQFIDLCAELKHLAARPFLIGIDHEGGRVTRLGPPFTPLPAMRSVGETNDPEFARAVGQLMARELRAANIDMNFAPVLDVDTNPLNPVIADRSFGRTPELVSRMGTALIDGLQSEGVAACGKHFPGHGDTSQDSHTGLPRLPHAMPRLSEIELPPFIAAARASVAAIMTAHVVFDAIAPGIPATLSLSVMTGLLRNQMGFDGVIISDDLEMKAIADHYPIENAVPRAVSIGVDLMLICHSPTVQNAAIDALIHAVERGEVSRDSLTAANRRLDQLTANFVRPPNPPGVSPIIGCDEHRRVVGQVWSPIQNLDPTAYIP